MAKGHYSGEDHKDGPASGNKAKIVIATSVKQGKECEPKQSNQGYTGKVK